MLGLGNSIHKAYSSSTHLLNHNSGNPAVGYFFFFHLNPPSGQGNSVAHNSIAWANKPHWSKIFRVISSEYTYSPYKNGLCCVNQDIDAIEEQTSTQHITVQLFSQKKDNIFQTMTRSFSWCLSKKHHSLGF